MNTEEETQNPQSNVLTKEPAVEYSKVASRVVEETVDRGDYEVGRDEPVNEGMAIPSNSELRGISINPLSSGYMVKVGCQSVAVESTEKLIDMLNKYLTDPAEFERKWYSNNVRNRLDNIK